MTNVAMIQSSSTEPRRRVLVVTPQPFFEERGTPIALMYVLRALGQLGCQVDVISFPLGTPIDLPGVSYYRTANPLDFDAIRVGFSFRKAFLNVALTSKLVRRLRSERYDAVHAVE